jgi:hypothetical protein
MTAACSSVEGNCGITVDPRSERLRPHARLPAGLPQGVDTQSLIQGPPAPG